MSPLIFYNNNYSGGQDLIENKIKIQELIKLKLNIG